MKKKSEKLTGTVFLLLGFLLSVAGATFFHALRMIWVFFSPYISFMGGAEGLFVILLINTGFLTAMLFISSYKPELIEGKRIFKILAVISCVITVLSALVPVGVLSFAGHETNSVIFMYLKRDMTIPALFTLTVLLLTVFHVLTENRRRFTALVCIAAVSFGMFLKVFPFSKQIITSDPCVFDTGEDYSVVFSTASQGTAYVEYTFNGDEYKVYAQNNGRIVTDRFIHSVKVPYEHLNGNSYTIGSTKVKGDYSYGSNLGKTAEKGPYDFSSPVSEKQKYLVVSDWHTYLKDAYAAISYIGDYDAVLLMGDPSAGMDFEEEAVKYIVGFGGRLTGGTKPVIYARGNHETRGEFAAYLPEYLGYDKLYYTVDRGDYSFIVLDSGEDKEDSHVEYGSLDDYRKNREEMVEWLEQTELKNGKYIALSHAWQISEPEPELSERAWNRLYACGTSFMISGHTHECRFLDGASEDEKEHLENYPRTAVYLDGGHYKKTYIASAITLSPEGVLFEAYDNSGKMIVNEAKPWR